LTSFNATARFDYQLNGIRFATPPTQSGFSLMYNITHFTLADMTRCGAELRELSSDATSMEDSAGAIVRHLYENLHGPEGRACALVRLYKTHPYSNLPAELRDFGRQLMPDDSFDPNTKCLTLLATAGDEPQWNDRHASQHHRAVPLPSAQVVEQFPMIAQLMRQFGIPISSLLEGRAETIHELDQKTYNVFYVPESHIQGPYIPAQDDFVVPYKIKSALGFGGVLPSGSLFAVIMFSKVPIPMETARMFRTIAINVKMNLLRFVGRKVFAD
jgi:hypothetical protein